MASAQAPAAWWELIIEAEDGRLVGWYSGRRWRSGGTIFLRSRPTAGAVERGEPVMHMRGRAVPLRVEILAPLTRIADAHIAVLTACAMPLVEGHFTPVIPAGG